MISEQYRAYILKLGKRLISTIPVVRFDGFVNHARVTISRPNCYYMYLGFIDNEGFVHYISTREGYSKVRLERLAAILSCYFSMLNGNPFTVRDYTHKVSNHLSAVAFMTYPVYGKFIIYYPHIPDVDTRIYEDI